MNIKATTILLVLLCMVGVSAMAQSASDLVERGERYYDEKKYSESVDCFRKAAEKGFARAQSNLGWCYEKGKGVAKDKQKAAYWYAQAAEQGYKRAQYNLGRCYEKGKGVSKDKKKAVYWYTQAAEQGHSYAQYKVGKCYYDGDGCDMSLEKAVNWYKQAAEQGVVDAEYKLAKLYFMGKGVKQDRKEAFRLIKTAYNHREDGSVEGWTADKVFFLRWTNWIILIVVVIVVYNWIKSITTRKNKK